MEVAGAVAAIGSITALTLRVAHLISELKKAGDEFEGVANQFDVTSTVLSNLENLLNNASLPLSITSKYTSDVQRHQSYLDSIERRVELIRKNLASRYYLERFFQRHVLVNGELKRLMDQILVFNSNLNTTLTTYNSIVISLVHGGVCRVESGIRRVETGISEMGSRTPTTKDIGVDIILTHVEEVVEAKQDEILWRASTPPPAYNEFQPPSTTGGWGFDRDSIPPPDFLSATIKVQERETQGEPVPITCTSTGRNLLDLKLPKQEPVSAIGPWIGGCLPDSKTRSTPPPSPGRPQIGAFQPPAQIGLRGPSDTKRVQDVGFWMLEQMRGYEYGS